MGNIDINQIADRAEGFDGFIQLQEGSNFYKFNTLQTLDVEWDWLDTDRYDVNGNLALVRAGQNHEFDMEIILTNDEADTVSPPTNTKTISYWIYQKEILKNRVTGTYVGKFKTKNGGSTLYVNLRVTLDIQRIGTVRVQGDVVSVPVHGRVIAFTNMLQEAS